MFFYHPLPICDISKFQNCVLRTVLHIVSDLQQLLHCVNAHVSLLLGMLFFQEGFFECSICYGVFCGSWGLCYDESQRWTALHVSLLTPLRCSIVDKVLQSWKIKLKKFDVSHKVPNCWRFHNNHLFCIWS